DWARKQSQFQSSLRSALAALPSPVPARLASTVAAELWPPPYRTSVSALETFAWCPFQHFAERGLRLNKRVLYAVSPADMGEIYHRVLQQFVNEMIEQDKTLADLSTEKIAENLERLFGQEVPKYAEKLRLLEAQQRRAKWRGRRDLPPALRGQ